VYILILIIIKIIIIIFILLFCVSFFGSPRDNYLRVLLVDDLEFWVLLQIDELTGANETKLREKIVAFK